MILDHGVKPKRGSQDKPRFISFYAEVVLRQNLTLNIFVTNFIVLDLSQLFSDQLLIANI